MRYLVIVTALALALGTFGCSASRPAPGEQTLMKCPICGGEHNVAEGRQAYEAAHGP